MNITVTTEASQLLNLSETYYVQKTKEERVPLLQNRKVSIFFSEERDEKDQPRHPNAQKCTTAHAQTVTLLKPGTFEIPFLFK